MAGDTIQNPIKGHFCVLRIALFARFDLFLGGSNLSRIDGNYLDTRSGEQFASVVSALQSPFIPPFIVPKDKPLPIRANFEVAT